jgi:hypothetical protein
MLQRLGNGALVNDDALPFTGAPTHTGVFEIRKDRWTH